MACAHRRAVAPQDGRTLEGEVMPAERGAGVKRPDGLRIAYKGRAIAGARAKCSCWPRAEPPLAQPTR